MLKKWFDIFRNISVLLLVERIVITLPLFVRNIENNHEQIILSAWHKEGGTASLKLFEVD